MPAQLLSIRALIFEITARTPGVAKSGEPAIYTHCQTTIVADFQTQFPDEFLFAGNRAIRIAGEVDLKEASLRILFASELTYHSCNRRRSAP